MTLLSAGYLTCQRLHGLGDDMAHTDFWPASGFKYTDAFPRMCRVPDYSFRNFPSVHGFELYMPNVWLRGGL
jgi:hypothetical protein